MTKALIIIDVQKGMFANPDMQPHDGEGTVARLADVLGRARGAGVPVFFVQHNGGANSPLAKDSPGFPFHEALTPQPGEDVTVKNHCSAFQDTDFHEKLIATNPENGAIDHIIVGGMQSEFCVDTAVRGLFERGLKVTLVADGHTTFGNAVLSAEQTIAHHNELLGGGGFAELKDAAAITFG